MVFIKKIFSFRSLSALFLFFWTVGNFASEVWALPSLEYTLTPCLEGDSPHLKIQARFQGNFQDHTFISLPDFSQTPDVSLKNLEVFSSSSPLKEGPLKNTKILYHSPGDLLCLSYEIHGTSPHMMDLNGLSRPILRADFFHALGESLWIYPLFSASPLSSWSSSKFYVTLRWQNLPPSWKVASSYGLTPVQTFKTTRAKLKDSFFTGGDLRFYPLEGLPSPSSLILHGHFALSDEDLKKPLQTLIQAQENFFSCSSKPYLIHLFPNQGPYKVGQGLTNGFVSSLPTEISQENLSVHYAHENLHRWMGGQIPYTKKKLAWFFEGFTDYYAFLFSLRTGLWSLDTFISHFNDRLKEYYMSPVRHLSHKEIKKKSNSSYEIQRLPYNRGFLFAFYLDGLLRKETQGRIQLDPILQTIVGSYKQKSYESVLKRLNQLLKKYLPKGLKPLIHTFIEKGEIINPSLVLSSLPLRLVPLGIFDLGFSQEDLLKYSFIRHLNPNSNAYAAGLREGNNVYGWSFRPQDPTSLAHIRLDRGMVSFYPVKNTSSLLQLSPQTLQEKEGIFQWFFSPQSPLPSRVS